MIRFHNAKQHMAYSNKLRQILDNIQREHWTLKEDKQIWIPRSVAQRSYIETAQKTNIRIPFSGADTSYAVMTIDDQSNTIDRIAVVGDQQTLFDLVRYGAYQPESLIAKLIASLGNYRLDILKRAHAGFQTELHHEKLKITVFSQRLLEAFLVFERAIHQPNSEGFSDILQTLIDRFKTLYCQFEAVQIYDLSLKEELSSTRDSVCELIRVLKEQSDRCIDDAKELLIHVARIINRQGQTLNRMITEDDHHSTAVLRGHLNDYFENNLMIINNYDLDFLPVFSPHQGLLPDTSFSPEGVVLSDLLGIKRLDYFALIIDEIKIPLGQRRADLSDTFGASQIQPLLVINNPNWQGIGGAINRAGQRLGKEILGFFKDTFYTLPCESYGKISIAIDHLRQQTTAISVSAAEAPVVEVESSVPPIPVESASSIVSKAQPLHRTWYSRLGTIVMTLGKRAITRPLVDNVAGGLVSFHEKKAELDNYLHPKLFKPSQLFDLRQRPTSNPLPQSAERPVSSPRAFGAPLAVGGLLRPRLLYAPYVLNDHGSSTLLDAAAHGAESFADIFVHHIYGKNPIIGLIYSGLFATSAIAVWFGLGVGVGGHEIAGAMLKMSSAISNGTAFGGISVGSTVAQVGAGLAELIAHGHESWIATGLKTFSENPFTITAAMIFGFSIGYVITEVAHIPFISEYLADDLGSIPEFAQFFVGLKVAAVSFEIFLAPTERKILQSPRLSAIPMVEDKNEFLKVLQAGKDFLPFLSDHQKRALVARLPSEAAFDIYCTRINAKIKDLIQDGTFLRLGGDLAYLSDDKKFAILNACKTYKDHQALHGLLFPHAKRSVVGETLFRVLRPPVRILAAVGIAASAVTYHAYCRDKVGQRLRFAGKEVVRAVVHDIGVSLLGDSVKASFKMSRTLLKVLARMGKSTLVAFGSIAAKGKKISVLAGRGFKAQIVSGNSPMRLGVINGLKKKSGDKVDALRTRMWFKLRQVSHQSTIYANAALYKLEHWILQHDSSERPPVRSVPVLQDRRASLGELGMLSVFAPRQVALSLPQDVEPAAPRPPSVGVPAAAGVHLRRPVNPAGPKQPARPTQFFGRYGGTQYVNTIKEIGPDTIVPPRPRRFEDSKLYRKRFRRVHFSPSLDSLTPPSLQQRFQASRLVRERARGVNLGAHFDALKAQFPDASPYPGGTA